MRRPKQLYEHFEFAEPKGNEAKARLQLLCDLINKPPRWLNEEGVETFVVLVRRVRDGTVPELALTEKIDVSYYDGRWHVGLSDLVPAGMDAAETMWWLYQFWVTNPLRTKFDGPCPCRRNKKECGKYYVRRTSIQKYCSRRCGMHAAAVAKSQANYNEVRAQKLDRARAALQMWKRTPAETRKTRWHNDWKGFVHSEHRDITPNFLTHAVNEHDITPPKGEK